MSAAGQQGRWLAIVGIGEDGAEGLSPAARALIANARLVIGGKRHLALADGLPNGERRAWPSPLAESIPEILAHRGEPVAVLASGDPYCFGVGAMLSAHVPVEETICVPAPSSLSLACARLGWALDDLATVSLCGRSLETLAPSLQPKASYLAGIKTLPVSFFRPTLPLSSKMLYRSANEKMGTNKRQKMYCTRFINYKFRFYRICGTIRLHTKWCWIFMEKIQLF